MKINELMGDVVGQYTKQAKAAENGVEFKKRESVNLKDTPVVKQEGDRVEISRDARLMLKLDADANSRADRIERIRQQIQNGSYKPNIEKTAKAILKEWMGE